jgi:hypothetical protein
MLAVLMLMATSCGSDSSGWGFDISSISPANGATGVPCNELIVITFNNDLNWNTIVWGVSFNVVYTSTGVQVPGSITLTTQNTLLFTPTSLLTPNTQYTIIMSGVIEDIWGDFYEGVTSSVFTTGAS